MPKENDMKIVILILFVCVVVGCVKKDSASTVSPEQPNLQSEAEHGPAEKDTSIAARLAEDFMKTQADANRYSKRATAVHQEEIGVYIVRFQLLDNSSKNHALVNVILGEKRCERIRVK
jgi:hypothetical protein